MSEDMLNSGEVVVYSKKTVAVVGLGKIGLPLAVQYAQHGHHVIGCDVNAQVVETINRGECHIKEEPGLIEGVAELVQCGLLTATQDTSQAVRQAQVVVVIVPVLVDAQHRIQFDYIDAATVAIAAGLQAGTLVIYETTLPVGTTARRFGEALERLTQLSVGRDFYLAHSPERVFSGRIFRDLATYPKIVGGVDAKSTALAAAFYRSVLDAPILTSASADEAEFVKLIDTTYRDVNIALANEFACYADVAGLDISTAIAAANSQPYSHIHTLGIGVGGHCIPVYPYFLYARLEELKIAADENLPMLLLSRYARRINDSMAEYAVKRVEAITGALAQRSVLILGVAYRGNVHETAFTSAKRLQEVLIARGAHIYIDDPLFTQAELETLGYETLPAERAGEIQVIILQANHAEYQHFDFSPFAHCQVVLDGRGTLNRAAIEALGMCYITIGDGQYLLQSRPQADAKGAMQALEAADVVF